MSDININITSDEESKINMNVMETVPIGKYEEKTNKVLGGNMPITLAYKENTDLVNDVNYPSLKYLAECFEYFKGEIGGSGGSVDLSDYFTKDETTRMIDVAISNVYGAIESEVKIINKEKENVSNKANSITDNGSNSEKYPSTKAVYEYGQGIVQASETYTEAYVAQEIGNIETALEEIIEKNGLGGDAT